MKIGYTKLFFLTFYVYVTFAVSWGSQKLSANLPTDLTDFESSASRLGEQWNSASIRHAIEQYSQLESFYSDAGSLEKVAQSHLLIGRLSLVIGDKSRAADEFLGAYRIAKAKGLKDLAGQATCELFLIRLENGDPRAAGVLLNQIRRDSEETYTPETLALISFSEAEFYYYKRDLKSAIAKYSEAIATAKSSGDEKSVAHYERYLGFAYMADEDYSKCLEILDRASRTSEESNDVRAQALTSIARGHALNHFDDKQGAFEAYTKAENLFPDGVDPIEKARLLNGIGKIYEDFGEYRQSLSYRKKAFDEFGQGGHRLGQAATLPSMAVLSYLTGDDDAAVGYFNQALALCREIDDKFGYAAVQEELGTFKLRNGDLDGAFVQLKEALNYFSEIHEVYEAPLIQMRLAQIHFLRGNISTAKALLDEALATNRKIGNKFAEAEDLYQLAFVSAANDEIGAALESAKESVALSERLSSDVYSSNLKTTYFANVHDRYELFLSLEMKNRSELPDQNRAVGAFRIAERSRARAMFENLALSGSELVGDAEPETVKKEKKIRTILNAKYDKLTELLSTNAARSETEKLDNEINELENQLEEIKAELKQKSPIYSAIKDPPAFDVEDFQQNVLDEKSILLEYSLGKEESYLWLVDKGDVNAFVLPPRAEIEGGVQRLRDLLADREIKEGEPIEAYQERIVAAEKEYWPEALKLSSILLGPVAERLQGKRLLVVADGKLLYFPISALPLPGADRDEPLLLSNEVVYEPSAQTLALLMKIKRKSMTASKDLLVFSDPVFTLDDARLAGKEIATNNVSAENHEPDKFRFVESLNNLQRLPSSGSEASAILNILSGSRTDSYTAFDATRERLLNSPLADYKILHFATHALTDEQRPELSGVVLSRYDEQGRPQDEFVRLNDIYGLKLNADLVVLSACETAKGKEVKGEGLISLNNAFLQVGGKSVLATTWKVEDGASLELMKEFYVGIANEGLEPSQALQQAQIKLWNNPQYRSPFYWAAFTIQGDPNARPDITSTSDKRAYVLGIVLLTLSGIYLIRKVWRKRYSTAKA